MSGDTHREGILLIAHGSREAIANREVIEMAERLSRRLDDREVVACFLDIADPSIPEGFRMAVARGCRKLTAVPFFLATGAHVGQDIPRILEGCRAGHPEVEIRITAALGPDPRLDDIAVARVEQGR